MKNPLNVLEINEKDNWFTAYSKGAAKGYVTGALVIGTLVGIGKIVVKCTKKDEVLDTTIEEEIGA